MQSFADKVSVIWSVSGLIRDSFKKPLRPLEEIEANLRTRDQKVIDMLPEIAG